MPDKVCILHKVEEVALEVWMEHITIQWYANENMSYIYIVCIHNDVV